MTVEELQREQERGVPKDDLKPYAGLWVALRDGHVIASDINAVTLRARPDVKETDTLLPVPSSPAGTFIL